MDTYWQSDKLAKLFEEMPQILVDEEIVPEVVKDMKRMAPVATGNLRDGIEPMGEGRIGITAENEQGQSYVEFVEFGTENAPAQPFIRPALYRKRGA